MSRQPASAGRLVSFEGGEGSGKSTQVALLAAWLESRGVPVTVARDPGTTSLGEAIRRLLLDPASDGMSPETELLLYGAARAELVRRVVAPALRAGRVVLLDRFSDSSFAYQGSGRGLSEAAVSAVDTFATGGLRPDLTVVLDVEGAEVVRRRAADAGRRPDDRIEREGPEFHERVRAAYRRRAAAEPERFVVVDGGESTNSLHERVRERVEALLESAPGQGAR